MNSLLKSIRLCAGLIALLCFCQTTIGQNLFKPELGLPVSGTSKRTTIKANIHPGETLDLFDEPVHGCIFHWWLTHYWRDTTMMQDLKVRLYYDGEQEPTVEVSLAQFFSVLLGKELYHYSNAALNILPKNALNCYFPIPYQSLKMELYNSGETQTTIWFMADYHQYDSDVELTPLRFQVIPKRENPAGNSFLMADLSGAGFIAGMTVGVRVVSDSDSWYHTGGDLFLLDGESDPNPIRGIGGEDVFNMSFGAWPVHTDWVGTLYKSEGKRSFEPGAEAIMYRIFGPAPIWFKKSAIVRFGSRANDTESIIYAYLDSSKTEALVTPLTWQLGGPFPLSGDIDFHHQKTWADEALPIWPTQYDADFGQYKIDSETKTYRIPVEVTSERGWVDIAQHFRGIRKGNEGTQPNEVFGYAVGEFDIAASGDYRIQFAYDDDAILWIDGEEVHRGKHEKGFSKVNVTHSLTKGRHKVKVKLSNRDNRQWRVWAFNFHVTPSTKE